MNPIRAVLPGPINDVDDIISTQSQVDWIAKSCACEFAAANRIAIGKRPVPKPKKVCGHRFSSPLPVFVGLPQVVLDALGTAHLISIMPNHASRHRPATGPQALLLARVGRIRGISP